MRQSATLADIFQTVSVPFDAAARRLGLHVTGVYVFQPKAKGYAGLTRRVARDRPDAVLVAGLLDDNAGTVIRDLRRRLVPRAALIGGDGLLPISARPGTVDQAAVYAAASAELALDAIAHSNGSRSGVLAALRRARPAGILGAFRLDARGDIRPRAFTIVRAVRPGGSDAIGSTEGAVWERVVSR